MSKHTQNEWIIYAKVRGTVVTRQTLILMMVGLVLAALKGFDQLHWSWWAATAPLWGSAGYFISAAFSAVLHREADNR